MEERGEVLCRGNVWMKELSKITPPTSVRVLTIRNPRVVCPPQKMDLGKMFPQLSKISVPPTKMDSCRYSKL
jgi:hypothetical protein